MQVARVAIKVPEIEVALHRDGGGLIRTGGAVPQLSRGVESPAVGDPKPVCTRVVAAHEQGRDGENYVARHLDGDGAGRREVAISELADSVVSPAERLVKEGERAAVKPACSQLHEGVTTLH
jgi:hypothetical protein